MKGMIYTMSCTKIRGDTMKKVNYPMALLATIVIVAFFAVGIGIALRSIWLVLFFLLLGFVLMGFGLTLKRKRK